MINTFDKELITEFNHGDWGYRGPKGAKFARRLAETLETHGIRTKIDKDGDIRRVHIPALSAYWMPQGATEILWDEHLVRLVAKL